MKSTKTTRYFAASLSETQLNQCGSQLKIKTIHDLVTNN